MSTKEKHNLTTMSTSDIHYLLNERIDDLRKPWPAVIQFPIIEIRLRKPSKFYFDPDNGAPRRHAVTSNLCNYFNGTKSATVAQIYFDPRKFPLPQLLEYVKCAVNKEDKFSSS